MAKTLKDLKREWTKLVEGDNYDGVSKTHDGAGGINKPHAKGETVKPREGDGVQDKDTPRRFDPSNGEKDLAGNTKSVDRKEGASAGRAETGDGDKEGTDKAEDTANPVDRQEGAEGGPKDIFGGALGNYRDRVRKILGLGDISTGEDKINKNNEPNKGLNQSSRSEDTKKNLG